MHRNTFSDTSMYGRGGGSPLVKHYLTSGCFLLKVLTGLSVTIAHACLYLLLKQSCQVLLDTHIFIKNFNRLVRYYLTRVFLIVRMLLHSG